MRSRTYLCGPAEEIIAYLKSVEAKYPGLNNINVGSVMGMPREVFKEQLKRFAEEVMPAFGDGASHSQR